MALLLLRELADEARERGRFYSTSDKLNVLLVLV